MLAPEMAIPTIILVVALITDIRTRRIPNQFIVIAIIIALINSFYFYEIEGLRQGALAGGLAIVMTLPLVLLGALGAGDMKLMFAFGLASTYSAVFSVLIFSFFWAALVGIGLALFRGRGKKLLQNIFFIVMTRTSDPTQLERIPYTIPLMMGWITFLALGAKQGAFL